MDVQAVPCGQLIFLACSPWDQAPGHVRLPLPVPRGTARRREGEDRRGGMGEVWAEGRAEDGIEMTNRMKVRRGRGRDGVGWSGWGGVELEN